MDKVVGTCLGMSPAIFHELAWNVGSDVRGGKFDDARSICLLCPVRAACLEYAISLPDIQGVFAGYDPKQIRKMKKARGRTKP